MPTPRLKLEMVGVEEGCVLWNVNFEISISCAKMRPQGMGHGQVSQNAKYFYSVACGVSPARAAILEISFWRRLR